MSNPNSFIGNCERCEKLGFEMCKCPKPYRLCIGDDVAPFKYLKAAIVAGLMSNEPFTVDSVEPCMIVCYWQPGMSNPVYNKAWQEYQANCQRELQRVTG